MFVILFVLLLFYVIDLPLYSSSTCVISTTCCHFLPHHPFIPQRHMFVPLRCPPHLHPRALQPNIRRRRPPLLPFSFSIDCDCDQLTRPEKVHWHSDPPRRLDYLRGESGRRSTNRRHSQVDLVSVHLGERFARRAARGGSGGSGGRGGRKHRTTGRRRTTRRREVEALC